MLKILSSFFTVLLFYSTLRAQNQAVVDSLLQVLKTDISDKEKVDMHVKIAKEYHSSDSLNTAKFANKAIQIEEKINYNQGAIDAFFEVAWVTMIMENYPKAEGLFEQIIQKAKTINYLYGKAQELNGLGVIGQIQGNHEKDLEYHFQCLKIREKIGGKKGIASSYNRFGYVYETLGSYENALGYAFRALKINEEIRSESSISYSLIVIGRVYQKQSKNLLSKKYLDEALILSKETGHVENIRDATQALSLVEKKFGNYRAAYNAQVLFKQMADNSQNEELTKKITRLGAEYEFQQEKDSIQFANRAERIVFEKEIKSRKKMQITTFIALGLSVTLVLVLFWFFRSKSRSNKLLTAKTEKLKIANDSISKQKEEIEIQNEQLQELNSLKDRVFSIIAHDLQSPIHSLHGVLTLFEIDSELTQTELREYMERVSEGVKGISELLNNLLYWARSQMQGELKLSPESLNMQSYIQEIIHLYAETARSKGIHTYIEVAEPFPMGYADPEILRFLLRNILNNAYKFSPVAGQVTVRAMESRDNELKIVVQDTGVGMNEETKEALFKGFVKSQQGTRSETGTGLGMMLCQEFVKKMDGSIGVESELRKGSTFWFTLPKAG